MLQLPEIRQLVTKAASGIFARHGAGVHDVMVTDAVDLDGRDALRVTLVISRGTFDHITGEDAGDVHLAINQLLQDAHDDRFPFLTVKTEEELEAVDDSEC